MFQEVTPGNHRLELVPADEVIVHPVLLTFPHRAGCVRHRNPQPGILAEHFRHKAGFTRARRGGNHKQGTLLTGLTHGVMTPEQQFVATTDGQKAANYTGFDLSPHPG